MTSRLWRHMVGRWTLLSLDFASGGWGGGSHRRSAWKTRELTPHSWNSIPLSKLPSTAPAPGCFKLIPHSARPIRRRKGTKSQHLWPKALSSDALCSQFHANPRMSFTNWNRDVLIKKELMLFQILMLIKMLTSNNLTLLIKKKNYKF